MAMTYEQKRAFHDATSKLLEKTEYKNIIETLQGQHKKGVIDEETTKYAIVAMFTIATEVRAAALGIDVKDLHFTKEEIAHQNGFFSGN